jgi:hypothetical protein
LTTNDKIKNKIPSAKKVKSKSKRPPALIIKVIGKFIWVLKSLMMKK